MKKKEKYPLKGKIEKGMKSMESAKKVIPTKRKTRGVAHKAGIRDIKGLGKNQDHS